MLEDPRVRIALFVAVTILLGITAWIGLRSDDAATTPAMDVSAQTTDPATPGDSETPGETAPLPSSSPTGPEGNDSTPPTSAKPSPSPTPSMKPAPKESPPPKAPLPGLDDKTVQEFLRAFNTFNWQQSPDSFVEKVVQAGAVPGSSAAAAPYGGGLLQYCIEAFCSTEFVEARKIKIGSGPLVIAEVLVRMKEYGVVTEQVLSCEITRASGEEAQEGLFVDAFCLGPYG